MTVLDRRHFLARLMAAAAGLAGMARAASAQIAPPPECSKVRATGIVDLHCHPSLKMYLWGERIWLRYPTAAGTNPLMMQITTDELARGHVKGMLCAHYLVEAAFTRESSKLRQWFPFIKTFLPKVADRIEHEDETNFTQINVMLDELESQVRRANLEQDCIRLVIARDFSEFEAAIDEGAIPVAHAIEGAHALGRNCRLTDISCGHPPPGHPEAGHMRGDVARYLRNLDALKARGVCLMTIAHIFENDVAFPTEGISPDEKEGLGIAWHYDPASCNRPLTPIGEAVVRRMLDIGMIVDLTHSTPKIREQVFAINGERPSAGKAVRPLTFTHAGSQAVFERYDGRYNGHRYDDYKFYDAAPEEIARICECNGVIGVIPENFWLLGCDTNLDPQYGDRFRDGIDYIVETILDVNAKTLTRDFDNVSIGTDFDGFADAPHDLHGPSQLGALVDRLRERKVSDEQIRKITSRNAMRLLRDGWSA